MTNRRAAHAGVIICGVSRLASLYARISPRLAHKPGSAFFSRAHAHLVKASGGRLGRRFLGADVLVLRTTGRRSGRPREAPLMFVRERSALVIVASNAASAAPPAWWLNLQAQPHAEAMVDGNWRQVTARRATEAEVEAVWPRLAAMYSGYDHYRQIASRELPVVFLEPRAQ